MVNDSGSFEMGGFNGHKSLMLWRHEQDGVAMDKRRCLLLYKIGFVEHGNERDNKNDIDMCSGVID